MKNFFTQPDTDERTRVLVRAASPAPLTREAKEKTRAFLHAYMRMHPAQSAARARVHGAWHVPILQFVAATLVIVITTGTSAAAESALPGDLLYPVKVQVNESVQAALTVSPKAKADFAIERAERRLEEAAALALSGALDETTSENLAGELARHVQEAEAGARLAQETAPYQGIEIEANLQAALAAHTAVLTDVAEDIDDPTVREHLDRVAERARGRTIAQVARMEGTRAEVPTTPSSDATMMMLSTDQVMQETALRSEATAVTPEPILLTATATPNDTETRAENARMQKKTDSEESDMNRGGATRARRAAVAARIETAVQLIERSGRRVAADVRTRVETQLEGAKQKLAEADVDVVAGRTDEALGKYDDALRNAIGARALFSARANRRTAERESQTPRTDEREDRREDRER